MKRLALIGILFAIAACGGGPEQACNGGTLQILKPEPGYDMAYQYLDCDDVTPRFVCKRLVGGAITCEGDPNFCCMGPKF